MNWTALLAKAGVPDSPGRAQAVKDAMALSEAKRQYRHGPKRKATTQRKPHYPSVKHSTD